MPMIRKQFNFSVKQQS